MLHARWQAFVEKVLEDRRCHCRMLADQQKQVQLLQEMLDADKETLDILIRSAVMSWMISLFCAALFHGKCIPIRQTEQLVKMTNLQWRLMTETDRSAAGKTATGSARPDENSQGRRCTHAGPVAEHIFASC